MADWNTVLNDSDIDVDVGRRGHTQRHGEVGGAKAKAVSTRRRPMA
jgi:hypothetical protein